MIIIICVAAGSGDENEDSSLTNEPANPQQTQNPSSSGSDSNNANNTTIGERNALRSAKNYLNTMPFSYSGLIKQLEFEGYSNAEATYAADHCDANWKEQAAKSAKRYLDTMAFSREGLIRQLEFEGFTREQAVYGVEANGY